LKEVAERKMEPCFDRIEKIRRYKRGRDQEKVKTALEALLKQAGVEGPNLMEPIIEATRSGATMGEIGGVLRMAYGLKYDPFGLIEPPFTF
jgi:methylmalonyl-CoA mutase N-terminal domain/subunit